MPKICTGCMNRDNCAMMCPALEELHNIWQDQNTKDKVAGIRNFRRQLGIQDAEVSQNLRRMAEKIIRRFPELGSIGE